MVGVVDPQCITSPCNVGEKSLGICHHATDTARMTRYYHCHRLTCQFCTILKQICLHDSCHLAPPERSYDDDILIIIQADRYGVDSRITARIVGISLDGIQQLRAQCIVVRLVLQPFLRRFNLQNVCRNLTGQTVYDSLAVTRIAVIRYQCLGHIGLNLIRLCLDFVLRRSACQQHCRQNH